MQDLTPISRVDVQVLEACSRFQTWLTQKSDDLPLPIAAVIGIIHLSFSISHIAA